MEKKYVKFNDETVIEATQVATSIQSSGEQYNENLLIQIDTSAFEDKSKDYYNQIMGAGVDFVKVYADEECRTLIFDAGKYTALTSITATVRSYGLLYSISLQR